jgi:hypothetical protein
MSLLRAIDLCKPIEDIQDIINNNNNTLYESDEYCNALARAAINLDIKLLNYLLSFDIDWNFENVFCYSMCTLGYLYPTFNEFQKEKVVQIFYKFASLVDIASENMTKCFDYILSRGSIYLLQLFIEAGYLDTREVPDCDALIYYRLKYFKELRLRN